MLVDLQIAPAGQLQREAAMLGELLEHVIEEADAGGDLDRRCRIQIDRDLDVRSPSCAARRSRGAPSARARSPARSPLASPSTRTAQAADAEVARELQIGVAIADHRAALRDPRRRRAGSRCTRPVRGLRQSQLIGRKVRADEDRLELDSLRAEASQDELVRSFEVRPCGKRGRAQAVLVGDHHEPVAAALAARSARRTRRA